MSGVRPLKSLESAYPAVTITNMLSSVPRTVLATAIMIERIKFAFWNVFWYASTVKSIGQKVTCPLFAAALPLNEMANRFTSGSTQISAINTKNTVFSTINIFLAVETRLILCHPLKNPVPGKLVRQPVCDRRQQQSDS